MRPVQRDNRMAEVENFLNGMSLARFIKGYNRLTYSHFDEITRLPIIDFLRHRQNQNRIRQYWITKVYIIRDYFRLSDESHDED